MSPRDHSALLDMLAAGADAMGWTEGMTFDGFEADGRTSRAVVFSLVILGEAAARISEATKAASPAVPWARMRGTRNRLVHEYDDIDLAVAWRIVTVELPTLMPTLRALLPPEKPVA